MLYRRNYMARSPFAEKPLEVDSRRWLIHHLDIQTARIVRRRDRKCVTCGASRNLQCSHYYSRRYLATRFDLRNCNAQCAPCNRRHNEEPSAYLKFMIGHYGPAVVEELNERRMRFHKVSDEELRQLLECLKP